MRFLAWTFCVLGFLALMSGAIFTFAFEFRDTTDWAQLGQRGDFYGGHIGATSSLAGSLLLFAAILFQARELQLQREQLKLQSEEMRQAIDIYEKQAAQIKEQTHIAQQQSVFSQILELATFKFRLAEEMRLVTQELKRQKRMAVKMELANVPKANMLKPDIIAQLKYQRIALTHQWNSCVTEHKRLLRSECLSEEQRINLDDIVFAAAFDDDDEPRPPDSDQQQPVSNG